MPQEESPKRSWHVLVRQVRSHEVGHCRPWPIRGRSFFHTSWARFTEDDARASAQEYASKVLEGREDVVELDIEIAHVCPRCAGSGVEPGRVRARCRGDGCPGAKGPWPGLLAPPKGYRLTRAAPGSPVPALKPLAPYGPDGAPIPQEPLVSEG